MACATTDDNYEIYYESVVSGPTVIFVSGYIGIANIWKYEIQALQSRYRCITLDNRGYGRSSKPLEAHAYSIERNAKDVLAVLDNAGIEKDERVVLLSHSMGSCIISTFTSFYPERVAGLLYSGSFYDGPSLAASGQGNPQQYITDNTSSPSKAVKFYISIGLAPDIAAEAAKWPQHSLKYNVEAMFRWEAKAIYAAIKVPCLIIHGEGDNITPLDPCVSDMVKELPNARLETLEDVSHFPPTEAPERFTKIVKSFLSGIYA